MTRLLLTKYFLRSAVGFSFSAPCAILAMVVCGVAPSRALAADAPEPQILVTGEGSVAVTPDLARVRGGVTTRAATVKEAADANARAMTAVIAKLVDAGIDNKDIQTAQFSIQPVYAPADQHTEQKVVAYSVSNQVIAKIRNPDKVSDAIDRMIAGGATNVTNVEFLVSDTSNAYDQARRVAVADARRKAELYANAAGVALGPVVSIAEEGASAPQPLFASAKFAGVATPIAVGENMVRVSVSVGFALGH